MKTSHDMLLHAERLESSHCKYVTAEFFLYMAQLLFTNYQCKVVYQKPHFFCNSCGVNINFV